MDIFLAITGFIVVLLGIVGSFLPVLPGPLTGWIGLLLLHLTKVVPINRYFLGVTLGVALFVWVLDYFIPAIGTKKFGGTKYGAIGSTVGLIIGLIFMGPFGIVIGPFVGAFIGEIINDAKDINKALKAAIGSFMGFLTSSFLKFTVSVIFVGLYLAKFWEYKEAFFN